MHYRRPPRASSRAWLSAGARGGGGRDGVQRQDPRLSAGQLSVRADADLNSYLLVTLNHDRTVAFINPQIASTSPSWRASSCCGERGGLGALAQPRSAFRHHSSSPPWPSSTHSGASCAAPSRQETARGRPDRARPNGSLLVSLDGARGGGARRSRENLQRHLRRQRLHSVSFAAMAGWRS